MADQHALVMTDVVDSTPLAERLDDQSLSALWDAHDRMARKLMRRFHGREIDSSDGFLLLFDEASDALDYVCAYHAAIRDLPVPLQARAGLHVGPLVMRSNDAEDVSLGAKPLAIEGVAKPLVARVAAIAQGGQTLLTAEAHASLSRPMQGIEERHWWRLKGLEQPVRLFELVNPAGATKELRDSDKGWRVFQRDGVWLPLREQRHSLPADPDVFVGRGTELGAIRRRFDAGSKLVSLLGIGGVGKTRLARKFGWTWLGEYPGGVWFCDLSSARALEGVCHAVAQGLEVPLGRTEPVVQLGEALVGHGSCLVILDNFEQTIDAAEPTLGRWMERAPDARFLVTSRERLALRGESVLHVDAMDPDESGALFRLRAASARGEPLAASEDGASIAALVKLLDGLPLAIELAAARAPVMSVGDMLQRMHDRFALLVSSRARYGRQTTLRAAFDWSWDLLQPTEKSALAQLTVFEGSFSMRAAEAVVSLPPGGEQVIDLIQLLVEQSLVRRRVHGRFDLLASLREYAQEKLAATDAFPGSGPQAVNGAATRHAAYFASLSEAEAVAHGFADMDNLVAACRFSAAQGHAALAIDSLESTWQVLRRRGPFSLGLALANAVAAVPSLGRAASARVDRVRAAALRGMGQRSEALVSIRRALEAALAEGDRHTEARVRSHLGDLQAISGDAGDARTELELALVLARQVEDRELEGEVLTHLGILHERNGSLGAARASYEAALVLARAAGDRHGEVANLGNLGALHADQGRTAEALEHYGGALTLSREVDDKQREGDILCNLGLLHFVQGRLAEARACLEASQEVAQEMGYVRLGVVAMCNLGIVLGALGEGAAARAAFEGALANARAIGDQRSEGQALSYLGVLLARQGHPTNAEGALDQAEQVLTAAGDRLSLGILQCHRAEAAYLARDVARGRSCLDAACGLALELQVEPQSELGLALTRVCEMIGETCESVSAPLPGSIA